MDINQNDFNEAIDNLCKQIRQSQIKFDFIVGISRGGLIPSVLLSHRLQIPLRTVEWSTRDSGLRNCSPDIAYQARYCSPSYDRKNILVVDDIVDSGITIKELLGSWQMKDSSNVKVACIVFNKEQRLITPDFYYEVIDRSEDKQWVNFWWEQNESTS